MKQFIKLQALYTEDDEVKFQIEISNGIVSTSQDFFGYSDNFISLFCYSSNGYSSIHVKIDNHGTQPNINKTEFFIKTLPASINKLGSILSTSNPKKTKSIEWNAD